MIPKDDGSKRPISVAMLGWRVGMSAILSKFETCIEGWAPEELVGGLPARGRQNHA